MESPNEDARVAAAQGLVELGDARATQSLANYFWRDPQEASRRGLSPQHYLAFIHAKDTAKGIDFAMRMLQSQEGILADYANDFISGEIYTSNEQGDDPERLSSLALAVQDVALRSKNAVARTRAKLWLQRKAEFESKYGRGVRAKP